MKKSNLPNFIAYPPETLLDYLQGHLPMEDLDRISAMIKAYPEYYLDILDGIEIMQNTYKTDKNLLEALDTVDVDFHVLHMEAFTETSEDVSRLSNPKMNSSRLGFIASQPNILNFPLNSTKHWIDKYIFTILLIFLIGIGVATFLLSSVYYPRTIPNYLFLKLLIFTLSLLGTLVLQYQIKKINDIYARTAQYILLAGFIGIILIPKGIEISGDQDFFSHNNNPKQKLENHNIPLHSSITIKPDSLGHIQQSDNEDTVDKSVNSNRAIISLSRKQLNKKDNSPLKKEVKVYDDSSQYKGHITNIEINTYSKNDSLSVQHQKHNSIVAFLPFTDSFNLVVNSLTSKKTLPYINSTMQNDSIRFNNLNPFNKSSYSISPIDTSRITRELQTQSADISDLEKDLIVNDKYLSFATILQKLKFQSTDTSIEHKNIIINDIIRSPKNCFISIGNYSNIRRALKEAEKLYYSSNNISIYIDTKSTNKLSYDIIVCNFKTRKDIKHFIKERNNSYKLAIVPKNELESLTSLKNRNLLYKKHEIRSYMDKFIIPKQESPYK